MIGTCLIYYNDDEGENHWDISYNLRAKYWRKGYVTEAIQQVMFFAKEKLDIDECITTYAKENTASGKVLEKLNFKILWEELYKYSSGEAETTGIRVKWEKQFDEKREIMDYKAEAAKCVNQYVLPEMKRQFEECGCSLDEQYKKYGNMEYFFANIIEPGHIYEIGYPRCVCLKAQSEKDADPNFCECSRQSILYVYENLIPKKKVTVETIETALTGGSKCRFRVIVE